MSPQWDDHYPDRSTLRNEVNHMADIYVRILETEIPEGEIDGIYFKGSGQKRWKSPMDYVPELSDLDIHILFSDDALVEKRLGTVSQVATILSKVEETYLHERPNYLHFPRPQIVILNHLLREEGYVPSPQGVVSVLRGKKYPEGDYGDQAKIRRLDADRLINEEEFLKELPLRVVDKPSRYLWSALRLLVWHVSPSAPRVLDILGLDSEKAWSVNRTEAISLLKEFGEDRMAEDYSRFYFFAWEYFLSGYTDSSAARTSLVSGAKAMTRATEVARSWVVEQGSCRE